jgi:hypothetical protein
MRLSIEKRSRVIALYLKHNLQNSKGKYKVLSQIAANEDIFISSRRVKDLVD